MRQIELLKLELHATETQLERLRLVLHNFERPIKLLLLEKNQQLADLSVKEILQIANLLVNMNKEVEEPNANQEA